jgi:hypothetical protein
MMPCTAFTTRHFLCCSLYTLHIQVLCHMLVWGKVRKTVSDETFNVQIFSNISFVAKKLLVDLQIEAKMFKRSCNIKE